MLYVTPFGYKNPSTCDNVLSKSNITSVTSTSLLVVINVIKLFICVSLIPDVGSKSSGLPLL